MKKSYFVLCLSLGVAAAVVGRGSVAQTPASSPDDFVMERFERLAVELDASKQTNALAHLVDLVNAINVLHATTQAGMSVAVLERLRSGRTNDVIGLVETHLDGALTVLSNHTGELRDNQAKILEMARQYRATFPRKTAYPEVDAEVAHALESKDSK